MNNIQEQSILRQQRRAERLVSMAHDTMKVNAPFPKHKHRLAATKRDQINAGWALNSLARLIEEAG